MKILKILMLALVLLLVVGVVLWYTHFAGPREVTFPFVPKAWDEAAFDGLDVPLAYPEAQPTVHISPKNYYRLRIRPIYKTYPVYHPDHEPEGYLEKLRELEPEPGLDWSTMESDEDWIRAGEIVFDAPTQYNGLTAPSTFRDPEFYEEVGMPVAGDGTVPYFRYVIREKGKVEVGEMSCAACHSRVMPDGSVIRGAQGNFPMTQLIGRVLRAISAGTKDQEAGAKRMRSFHRKAFGAPWVEPDPMAPIDEMSMTDIADLYDSIPPGVQPRTGTSLFYPVQVPDLIGLEDRRFFDRTGDRRHRDIGDLMRYAALAQHLDNFNVYGRYDSSKITWTDLLEKERYMDAELYAVSLYVYSLEPPENPHPMDERAILGAEIFERERCSQCHQPPGYTNNKLTPAAGFEVPEDHPNQADILDHSLRTDPGLALRTRRGTGFYKVPSLQGVWYRGPLEHSGSVATLEDWFDPARQRDDYVPTGFPGWGSPTRAIPGHDYGLDLPPEEREALIAFLRTL